MAKQVKVYSTPTCPWCIKVKQWLDAHKVSYQDLNVAVDKAARDEMVNKTGRLAVPVIEIDDEVIVGYDENWLRQKLGV